MAHYPNYQKFAVSSIGLCWQWELDDISMMSGLGLDYSWMVQSCTVHLMVTSRMGVDQCLNQEVDIPTSAWDCCIMSSAPKCCNPWAPKCCNLPFPSPRIRWRSSMTSGSITSGPSTKLRSTCHLALVAYSASENLDVFLGILCAAGMILLESTLHTTKWGSCCSVAGGSPANWAIRSRAENTASHNLLPLQINTDTHIWAHHQQWQL